MATAMTVDLTASGLVTSYPAEAFGIVDRGGTLVYASPNCETIYGLPVGLQVGKNVRELMDDGIYQFSVALRVLELSRRTTGIKKTRAGYWLVSTGTPILDDRAQVAGVLLQHRPVVVPAQTRNVQLACQDRLVAESSRMQRLVRTISEIAGTDENVLITGETGTGKSLICQLIHNLSPRREAPLLRINCASDPEVVEACFYIATGEAAALTFNGMLQTLESECGGTVVLEEVTELPAPTQCKLVRILQGQLTRASAGRPGLKTWRFLSTASKDPRNALAAGQLRPELYHRLATFELHVPPLRERLEDLPKIAWQLLKDINAQYGLDKTLGRNGISKLLAYKWPGNIHELRNVLVRAAFSTDRPEIQDRDVDFALLPNNDLAPGCIPTPRSWDEAISETEKRVILGAAASCSTLKELAVRLGLSESTLRRRVRTLFGSWRNLRRVLCSPAGDSKSHVRRIIA